MKFAGPTPPAHAAGLHLFDNVVGRHLEECLGGPAVAVAGDIVVDLFGIDEAFVAQGTGHLVGEKGDIGLGGDALFGGRILVKQPLHRLALDKLAFDQLRNIIHLELLVEDIPRLDHHDGPHGAKAVAAGFHDLHLFAEPLGVQFALKRFDDLDAAGGMAARAAAGQQIRLVPEGHALGLLFLDSLEVIH